MRQRKIDSKEMEKEQPDSYQNNTGVVVLILDAVDYRKDALLEIKRIYK